MKVKIRFGDKLIERVAYADVFDSNNSYIIALDENNEKLKRYKILNNSDKNLHYNVFFFESPTKDWIESSEDENISGYDWFIADKFAVNCENEKVSAEILNKCKEMQKNVRIEDKYTIKNRKDVSDLLYLTDFHDAFVKDIAKNKDEINIVLDTTWDIIIHFTLKGNPKTNLTLNYGCYGEIFSSTMFIENQKIYWTNEANAKSFKDIEGYGRYFCADTVTYTVEIL